MKFRHENLACDLVFENLLPGWTRGTGEIMFGMPEKQNVFGWVVAQPRARVSGTLTVDGIEHQVTVSMGSPLMTQVKGKPPLSPFPRG